ncbi:MAG: acetylornithine deacetylase [Burkholderiaceae bacterium]
MAAPAIASVDTASQTVALLAQLVAIDTTSRNSNLGLIELARDKLARLGVASRLTYDAAGGKANLFATGGEGALPGMILSGHTDTVPVDGQAWSSDPFKLTQREGKLFARGSADMKGFIACALAAVPAYLAGGSANARPFHLALSYDEEVGCFGVHGLIKDIAESGARVSGCIVGEPSSMQPIIAHKGTHRFRCCVRGKEAHSAMTHQGVNAIHYASKMMVFLQSMADEIAAKEARDPAFPVPTSTITVTMIDGGTGQNIIPRHCNFQVDVRTMPGTSFDDILARAQVYAKTLEPEMHAVCRDSGIAFDFQFSMPGFGVAANDPLVRYVAQHARAAQRSKVSFGTEAGIFTQQRIPTVVIGPGNIEQAHQPDEFVELSQLAACDAFLARVLANPFESSHIA